MIPGGFDPRQVAPSTGEGGQLPVSDKSGLVVVIADSSIDPTNDKTGWLLKLTLEVVEGPHTGTSGFVRLNLGNASAEAVKIAMSELSAICHVVGHLSPLNDVAMIYNKKFRVITQLQKDAEAAKKGYTEVKAYRDYNGNKPGQSGQASVLAAAPAQAPAPAPAASFPAPAPSSPSASFPQVQSNVPVPQQYAQPQAPAQPQQASPPWAQQAPASNTGAPPWAQPQG